MDSLLQHSRWDILRAVSERDCSATAISEQTGSSLPNVTQQLKLLEAHDLLQHNTLKNGKAGKPRKVYSLREPFCHITLALEGFAAKRMLHPDEMQEFLLRTFFLPSEDQPFIIKALLCNNDLMERCAIAFLKRPGNDIELFALTRQVEDIREKYSNINVDCGKVGRKIALWTHHDGEVRQGLENEEPYYQGLIRDMQVLHDPENEFEKVVE